MPNDQNLITRESLEICILAGGLSARMGRDKSRLRLGRTTMLALVRDAAKATGLKVRVIRHDLVRRCGPLGGIYSGLKTTKADAVIFLACDMPFVTPEIIDELAGAAAMHPGRAVLLRAADKVTFPILIPRSGLQTVTSQIKGGRFSLQSLGEYLPGKVIHAPRKWLPCLENINTPADLERARTRVSTLRRH